MSRSGYSEDGDFDDNWHYLFPAIVSRSIKGKRGQEFLNELAAAMDAMPEKKLIKGDLVTPEGACCTIGVVCKARNIDISGIEINDPEEVGAAVGISRTLAAEIEWLNDDESPHHETDEQRWTRMRTWVDKQINGELK